VAGKTAGGWATLPEENVSLNSITTNEKIERRRSWWA